MSPRTMSAEERRADLIAAARAAFAEKGYERTTVSEIVKGAGVAQGTFYLYFDSKEALPRALGDDLIEQMVAAAEEAGAQAASLPESVAGTVRAIYCVASEFRDVLVIANRAIDLAESETDWREVTRPLRECIERFVRTWQEAGQADPRLDPPVTARVLMDLVEHSARAVVLFGDEEFEREVIRVMCRAVERPPEAGPG